MVKAEVEESIESEIKYPCLMVGNLGVVVLFSKAKKGVCVYAPKESFNYIGEYSEFWFMKLFTPFTGEITLRNE